MTPFEEAMAAPRIEVIDAAIKIIENGQDVTTCSALVAAVDAAFQELPDEDALLVWLRYLLQYRQSCWARGGRPSWWDTPSAGKEPRVAALKNFRQLCLDAAK